MNSSKIGRNEPCPCGSAKKYKKCCIGVNVKELTFSQEIDNLMQEGYSLLEKKNYQEACDIWLITWDKLKEKFDSSVQDIRKLDDVFNLYQFISNWVQDMEMELANLGLKDKQYARKRILFCAEFIGQFPLSADIIVHNMKRAIAESYYMLGDSKTGEEYFKKLIEEHPDYIWGYIGYGDMYSMPFNDGEVDFDKAEEIYSMALRMDLKNKEDLLDRLDDLKSRRLELAND